MFQSWLLILNKFCCHTITFGVTLASSLHSPACWRRDSLQNLGTVGTQEACLFSLERVFGEELEVLWVQPRV